MTAVAASISSKSTTTSGLAKRTVLRTRVYRVVHQRVGLRGIAGTTTRGRHPGSKRTRSARAWLELVPSSPLWYWWPSPSIKTALCASVKQEHPLGLTPVVGGPYVIRQQTLPERP